MSDVTEPIETLADTIKLLSTEDVREAEALLYAALQQTQAAREQAGRVWLPWKQELDRREAKATLRAEILAELKATHHGERLPE